MTFDDLQLAALRARRSAKWSVYPADVVPAWVAEMDFPLAAPIAAALHAAIERGDAGYPRPGELPEAFAAYAARAWDWAVDPARVFLVPDVVDGMAQVLRLLTQPGDAVAINPPIYPPFFSVPPGVERRVVEVPLAGGRQLDLDALETTFRSGTRTFLLCNPHNPSGRAFTRTELDALAALAARYGVLVIADEIHAPLVLPGATHTPFALVAAAHGVDAVVVTSASKAWNVAGLKCALVVSATPRLTAFPVHVSQSCGIFGIFAAVAAYREGGPWLAAVLAQLDVNRRTLAELVARELPAIRMTPPEASYLAWLDCRELGWGDDPARRFLERGRVALSPGPSFGREGRGFVRLNFATSPAILAEIVRRMAVAVA